ncbi:autoinducer-2 production protein [Streptococcus downei MFe28]|uniref:S-ribosylhomocysteine lyase n=1 Tax=Streptococcus downei MFe28 TaxID=764290 RepID=A0A380JHA3_STRDO|nr:autoinducer-2 production protein [Streptococcus downei MFe28]
MAKVESFELDHTKVLAPYVRKIDAQVGKNGDSISNFDVRFVQPNQNAIPTAGIHTIEHSLASLIRDRIVGMIDFSLFGCRTGFHLIIWGDHSSKEIALVIKNALEELVSDSFQWKNVPGVSEKQCGNYRDHSLFTAKEWAKKY